MSKILDIQDLASYYVQVIEGRKTYVKAVDGVSIEVKQGEVLGIIGESGCGKSTLARAILADFSPPFQYIRGSIKYNTKDGKTLELHKLSRDILKKYVWGVEISLVPQFAMNALMPTLKIRKLVMDIMRAHFKEVNEYEVIENVNKVFQSIGLPPDVIDRYPFELSGGMRQRVVLGIVATLRPRIMIADEPTSALDVTTQKMVLKTMLDLKKRGYVDSIVFITHEIGAARQIATRFAVMYAGKIVEESPTEEFIEKPYHPYSSLLLRAIPDVAQIMMQEKIVKVRDVLYIGGAPPSLINPPLGCRFHPRCPYAMDICRREEPPMTQIEKNRFAACWLYAKK
ncbi:MAG: ABC transporter ATP-binding protein [Ignisphaera sp.]